MELGINSSMRKIKLANNTICFGKPSLIVFDLDGTLVDSAPDIAFSIDTMLRAMGRVPVGEAQVRGWIGNGISMLVKRSLTLELWPMGVPEDYLQALSKFISVYSENLCVRSALYAGVRESLSTLKTQGYVLACVTNKHSDFAIPLLKKLAIRDYMDYIGCGNQFENFKPHPESLLRTAQRFDLNPEHCLMVGDSENDVGAARAAGYPVVCVSYGYRHFDQAEELGADLLIDSLIDLPIILNRLKRPEEVSEFLT